MRQVCYNPPKLVLVLAIIILILVIGWAALGSIPPPLLVNRANASCAVTDRDGKLLRLSLTGDEKYRLWVPLEAMPKTLVDATLNYEDRWFYVHPGVNPFALARAAWSSFVARDRWIGASTLTMQLVRQRFRMKTHTLPGKLRQMAYAFWLERHFSKQVLLEAYLNLAPYGANIEGAGAAAWIYYHKPLAELSLDQSRALVLIPQNPRLRTPFNPSGLQALQKAWRLAYGNDAGFERLGFNLRDALPLRAPHFAERVCEKREGSLTSTLDPTVQELTEEMLDSFVRQHQPLGISNAAAMVVDVQSMEVLGYVGSAGYLDSRIQGFVNGLKARRSPGSTLKPFIYALAIDQGLITPDTLLKDTPLRVGEYQPENFEGTYYGPLSATEALVRSRNIPAVALSAQLRQPTLYQFLQSTGHKLPKDESFYGLTLAIGGAEVSMEELITLYGLLANDGVYRDLQWLRDKSPLQSRSGFATPTETFEDITYSKNGSDGVVNPFTPKKSPLTPLLQRGESNEFPLTPLLQRGKSNESLITPPLQRGESNESPLSPYLQKGGPKAYTHLLSPESAFLVRRMLETNPPPQRSFGVRSYSSHLPVAWKTGTSSGLKDAWALGLMGNLLAGVWVGNFDGTPNRQLVGRDLAGPLLFGILEAVSQERAAERSKPTPPSGLKSVEICPLSGALRSPWCPHGKTGWIIPGISTIKTCAVHRQIHINPSTGLRLCRGDEGSSQPRVAEFWDSDVLELFRLAGVRRDTPPPFEKPCDDLEGGDAGAHPPAIISPLAGLTYPIRADGNSAIEFSSVSDGGRRRLFWFVDDTYVGEGKTVFWPGRPGQFIVRVVDEQGQSAAMILNAVPVE